MHPGAGQHGIEFAAIAVAPMHQIAEQIAESVFIVRAGYLCKKNPDGKAASRWI